MTRRARSQRHRPIDLSTGAFRHLAAALGLAILSTARADWSLQDSNFKVEPGLTINTWSPAEGLSATNRQGKLTNFSTRDILLLSSGQQPISDPASRTDWHLTLRNGDVLYGYVIGISGKSLQFKTPELGTVAVPLKRVSALSGRAYTAAVADKSKRVPASPDHDLIIFRETGDKLEGLVTGIDDTSIQLATDGAEAPTPIALSKIDTILFGGAKPPREIPPLSVRLSFVSGTIYTLPLQGVENPFNWTIGKLTVKDSAGQEHVANTDRIVSAEILGGRIVYLTELDFLKEEQTSFLGTSWPAQINKNALGQPMKVAHTTYTRGIGVHTQSTLIYQLDGTFDTLALRVGLDDSAAPLGEARASILLDGKVLWPPTGGPRMLKPGEVSEELSLPIKGGKRLELHADPTARLDVQGRVDWLNVALRRQ